MRHNIDKVTLYGAGGHCKVVIDILQSLGYEVTQVVDDSPNASSILNIPLLLPGKSYDNVIVSIGNCQVREQIVNNITANKYITAIHPTAIVSKTAKIGKGTVIVQGAIVQACSIIGDHCIVNTKASIGHDVMLKDFVHVASGATICGGATIGKGTWIGAGSVVKQGVKIGENCMIGAGSVVVKDIPDNVVAYGNPCRIIRLNEIF